jgi:predicted ferric reductase
VSGTTGADRASATNPPTRATGTSNPAGPSNPTATRTIATNRAIRAVLALAIAANAAVIVALWLPTEIHDTASALTSTGRIAGLLGAYLALIELLLLSRLPVLERIAGFDRLTVWHRRNGTACITLLVAHAVLITAGYTVGDKIGLPDEVGRLISGYPGVITATAGLVLLIAVTVTSIAIARRRLRYETWYFVHLYAYLAIALAFSHQIATGTEFVGKPAARAYWTALYAITLAVIVAFRIATPLARAARHRLTVQHVDASTPGVVTVHIEGRRLDRLRARSGQFFTWRFLTRDRWWEAHPFSLSAAPDGRRLRITVKDLGDYTRGLSDLKPGTRVLAEGPFGAFTAAARRRPRVALIAGGAGITPILALLEDMPAAPGDIAVVYRATKPEDVILGEELDRLAQHRGAEVHYVLGAGERLEPQELTRLVPDIAERDVYVCGPPAMTDATRASLTRSGVDRRQIFTERFAL